MAAMVRRQDGRGRKLFRSCLTSVGSSGAVMGRIDEVARQMAQAICNEATEQGSILGRTIPVRL